MISQTFTSISQTFVKNEIIDPVPGHRLLNVRRLEWILIKLRLLLTLSRRLRWAGHEARMEESRSAFKILQVNLQERDL